MFQVKRIQSDLEFDRNLHTKHEIRGKLSLGDKEVWAASVRGSNSNNVDIFPYLVRGVSVSVLLFLPVLRQWLDDPAEALLPLEERILSGLPLVSFLL